MRKIFLALLPVFAFACCDRVPADTFESGVPFGLAQSSAGLLYHPSGDGELFLDVSRSKFAAEPAYVKAFDRKAGAQTECSGTLHTLWHRFSWAPGCRHILKICPEELGHGPLEIRQNGPSELLASSEDFFLLARFSTPFQDINISGNGCEAVLTFDAKGGAVVVLTGLSYTSADEASNNITAETSIGIYNEGFVVQNARDEWASVYSVRTRGGSRRSRAALDRGLRQSALAVRVCSDGIRSYRTRLGSVSRARFDNVYSKPDDWLTVQSWVPLATLLYPGVLTDFCLSCCDMYGTEGEYMAPEAYPIVSEARNHGLLESMNKEFWALACHSLGQVPPAPDFSGSDSFKTLALLGLVPEKAPATGFSFCRPAFRSVRLRLGNGNELLIERRGSRKGVPKSVIFNGIALQQGRMELENLMGGGELLLKF